jgi:hypothetical protein
MRKLKPDFSDGCHRIRRRKRTPDFIHNWRRKSARKEGTRLHFRTRPRPEFSVECNGFGISEIRIGPWGSDTIVPMLAEGDVATPSIIDPNYHTPYAIHATGGVQHAFNANWDGGV